MNSTILVALIAGLSTAIPSVVATFVMSNAREALQGERMSNMSSKLDELTKKVDSLSDFDKRISLLEHECEILGHAVEALKKGEGER